MLESKHPFERHQRKHGKLGRAIAIVLFGAGSFPVVAAPFPTAPSNQEDEILQRVQTCFKKGPYADEDEAKMVAADAKEQGYTASVTKDTRGWVVRICKKASESSD